MLKPSLPNSLRFTYKSILWMVFDMAVIVTSYAVVIVFAYIFDIPYRLTNITMIYSIVIPFQIVVYVLFGLYRIIIRYASIEDVVLISFLVIGSNFMLWVFLRTSNLLPFPSTLFGLMLIFQWIVMSASRSSFRLYRIYRNMMLFDNSRIYNTLIIGAGSGGEMVIKELKKAAIIKNRPTVIVDDDVGKHNRTLLGVPIVGGTQDLLATIDRYKIQEVIIAINNLPLRKLTEWLDILTEKNIVIKRLPSMSQVEMDKPLKLVDVKVEDLLNRSTVELDDSAIGSFLKQKVVLVTGAGGSIGSELCRQIATFKPRVLVLFDIYENTTYDIQLELKRQFPKQEIHVHIGSVYNASRLESIFKLYQPSHVFHAAAYKHVPLMEDSAVEALRTNVQGTYQTAVLAGKYKTEHFLLVSSDKAVRPTNIMGATKRLAELVIKKVQEDYDTVFAAVRFGNVLNSNGSVVPLFRKQLEQGGPITVTHPEITRYFMTIPEAVGLILQAGVFANRGDIFILDMGEPVKIKDLAEKMVRLSGLKPHDDIEIKYIGLRPGEKLYEELLVDKDNDVIKTANEKIFIEQNQTLEKLDDLTLISLLHDSDSWDDETIKSFLKGYVVSYQPQSLIEEETVVQ